MQWDRDEMHRPSREVVSLLHHVELHLADWWDRAIEQTILAVLLASHVPLSHEKLARKLSPILPEVPPDTIEQLSERLIEAGQVILVDRGRLKLEEATRTTLEGVLKDHIALEARVERRFCDLATGVFPADHCSHLFRAMRHRFLEPLIADLGAATWRLLMSEDFIFEYAVGPLTDFLSDVPDELHDRTRAVLAAFLDPLDADVRRFVLRLLSAYFFTEARTLDRDRFEIIFKQLHAMDLTLVLDSPVLLGFVAGRSTGAKGSPAVRALLPLLQHGNYSHVRLCATAFTLDEVRSEIASARAVISGDAPQRTSRDSERSQGEIHMWLAAAQPRSPQDWLRRTDAHLHALVTGTGISVLLLPTQDEVIAARNIAADLKIVAARGESDPLSKGLDEWFHDVVLWHFVDLARVPVESVLEADWWLLTDDPELIAFDRNKAGETGRHHICIHPAALLHLLRFMSPQDDMWDEAFLSLVRAPLLVKAGLDRESERMAFRILDAYDWWTQFRALADTRMADTLTEAVFAEKFSYLGPAHDAVEEARAALSAHRDIITEALRDAEDRILETVSTEGRGATSERVQSIFMNLRGAVVAVSTGSGNAIDIRDTAVLSQPDAALLQQLVHALREDLQLLPDANGVPIGDIESVIEDLEEEGPNPRRRVVRQGLRTIRSVAESATGSVVFTHAGPLLERLSHLL